MPGGRLPTREQFRQAVEKLRRETLGDARKVQPLRDKTGNLRTGGQVRRMVVKPVRIRGPVDDG